MKSNGYITIVIIAGLGLIGYLFAISPATAPTQLPLILAGIGALVAVLNKQGDTDARVESSVAASKENAASIAAVGAQTGHALEGVNQKVDGHLSGLSAKVEELLRKVATLEQDKAVTRVETAQIIAAVVAAVPTPPATEIVPPTDTGPSRPGEHL